MTDYNTPDASIEQSATVTNDTPQAAPSTASDDTTNQQIADGIKVARLNIDKLPDDDRRELDVDTLRYFGFGYLETWRHPKMPNMKPTPRIIARLGSGDDTPSYNAILTNTGRKLAKPVIENSDDPPKWTEKSLSAGKKLVFNPRDLTKSIVIISEGEIDCASLWQACQRGKKIDAGNDATNIGLVALGGAGQCTDIINRLFKMVIKPRVLILFDGDKPGRNRAEEFRQKLWDIGVVAVIEFFDDTMSVDEKKPYDGKIDANAILQHEGTDALYRKFARVFKQARDNFKSAEIALKAWQEHQQSTQADKMKSAGADSKSERSPEIQDLIDRINREVTAEQLVDAGVLVKSKGNFYCCPWCGSGHGSHGTGALKVYPGNGVACHQCNKGGSVLTLVAHVRNATTTGKEFFEFLRSVADDFGVTYDPKIFEPPKYKTPTDNDFKTGDVTVDAWQRQFGVFDKQQYLEICAAKKFLSELTPETITAAVARSKSTLQKLALCSYYDFNLDAVDKFFATLDDAKSRAAAQVKESKSGHVGDESADVRALAALSVAEIKKSLAPLKTKIRKAHMEFVANFKSQRDAANVQAFKEQYLNNAPTTRKKIPDCPVDLIIPPTVYFGETECGLQTILPNGNVATRAGALAPVTIKKKFCDENGNTEFEVAIKTGGKWHVHCVDGRTLQTARGVDVLGNFGLPIEDTSVLAKYFARFIAVNDATLTVTKVYSRPGWHGDKFIYPVSDDGSYVVRRNGINYKEIFTPHGNRDDWLHQFIIIHNSTRQGALKRIILGACALPPLLEVFKIPNPQFNVWGTSNYAKTPLNKFGLSIYGDPNVGKMQRTWNSTAKNMLTMAAGFNGLPLYLDEAESMSKRTQDDISKFVYDFSLGVIGEANKRNGDVRQTEDFHSARISTAERPLHDDADKRGSFKRLIDLHVTDVLFNDDKARKLHILSENNYGLVGRQWTRYIEANAADIAQEFEHVYEYFADRGFARDDRLVALSTVDATNARAVIACAVAYWRFFKCLDPYTGYCDSDLRDDAEAILAELPTVDEIDDLNRSIRLLASWVVENPKRFRTPKKYEGEPVKGEYYEADSYASAVGIKNPDGSIVFFANAFRDVVAEIGLPNYKKFLCDLFSAGYLDRKKSHSNSTTMRVDGISTAVYLVKSDAFSVDDD